LILDYKEKPYEKKRTKSEKKKHVGRHTQHAFSDSVR
jgi:hypothetical protein